MKFKHVLFLIITLALMMPGLQAQVWEREDTLFIPEAINLPIINGDYEPAWDQVEWQAIDQVWMPWGNESGNLGQSNGLQLWDGANDFTGNFKVMWSSETNLLYFFVEITDDVFVDGYSFPDGGYPDYDIVEIFIDEDRSGGPHVFDNTLYPGMSSCPNCNAEQAFSYHIAANVLANSEVQTEKHAVDIAGTTWGTVRDYAEHIPDFAMKNVGDKYFWEFTLIVHNDSYNHSNQAESVVTLAPGKVFGISLAYCDNDNPNETPLRRDHFFGSVDVPVEAHNDHWMDADGFGVAKLIEADDTSADQVLENLTRHWSIYTENRQIKTIITSSLPSPVSVRIFNISGSEVLVFDQPQPVDSFEKTFSTEGLQNGIYLVEVTHGNLRKVSKILIQ